MFRNDVSWRKFSIRCGSNANLRPFPPSLNKSLRRLLKLFNFYDSSFSIAGVINILEMNRDNFSNSQMFTSIRVFAQERE